MAPQNARLSDCISGRLYIGRLTLPNGTASPPIRTMFGHAFPEQQSGRAATPSYFVTAHNALSLPATILSTLLRMLAMRVLLGVYAIPWMDGLASPHARNANSLP